MSHFCVLVIGENPRKQLEPFEEDCQEKYLEFIDITDEYERQYEWESSKMIRLPDGSLVYPWDEMFKSKTGEEGIFRNQTEIPKELLPKIDVYHKNRFASLDEFVESYHGETRNENGRYGYHANPNAKWDWYELGGRYPGRLVLKDKYKYVAKLSPPNFSWGWGVKEIINICSQPRVDQATKFSIDWSKCHQTKEKYSKEIRFWEMKVNGDHPVNKEEVEELKWDWYKKEFYLDRYKTAKIFAECESNFTVWAYVKNGKWFEKGEMGWFGLSGESDEEAVLWELGFYDNVIKPLPEETLLTIFDCHI